MDSPTHRLAMKTTPLPLVNVLVIVSKNLNGFLNFEITRWVTFRVLKKILFNRLKITRPTLANYEIRLSHVIYGHVIYDV